MTNPTDPPPAPDEQSGANTEADAKPSPEVPKVKLPWHAHVFAGWPFLLVLFGGMIGGACGGLAWGISTEIIKKKGPSPFTYFIACVIGCCAVALYVAIGVALILMFPNTFGQ